MAAALQEELLLVPGIAGAEVDEDSGIAGVRVQLAEGADAEAVGTAVRRILVEHGMRPAPGDGDDAGGDGPPPPPGAPGSVVSFPLVGEHARPTVAATTAAGDEVANALESVAVEETPAGVQVSVRTTAGTRASRSLNITGSGMDEAVAAAIAEVTGHPAATLLGVSEAELSGNTVVTALVGIGERRVSGSAVQQGGRAYAVARAVWAAIERS